MTDSRNICILLSLASPSLAGVYWALDNVCTKGDKVTILCVVDKESEREQGLKETKDLVGYITDPKYSFLQYQVQVTTATSVPGVAACEFVAIHKPTVLVVSPFSKFAPEQAKKESDYCIENASCTVVVATSITEKDETKAEGEIAKAAMKGLLFKPKVSWF